MAKTDSTTIATRTGSRPIQEAPQATMSATVTPAKIRADQRKKEEVRTGGESAHWTIAPGSTSEEISSSITAKDSRKSIRGRSSVTAS
jgi:hypothetical protein